MKVNENKKEQRLRKNNVELKKKKRQLIASVGFYWKSSTNLQYFSYQIKAKKLQDLYMNHAHI